MTISIMLSEVDIRNYHHPHDGHQDFMHKIKSESEMGIAVKVDARIPRLIPQPSSSSTEEDSSPPLHDLISLRHTHATCAYPQLFSLMC